MQVRPPAGPGIVRRNPASGLRSRAAPAPGAGAAARPVSARAVLGRLGKGLHRGARQAKGPRPRAGRAGRRAVPAARRGAPRGPLRTSLNVLFRVQTEWAVSNPCSDACGRGAQVLTAWEASAKYGAANVCFRELIPAIVGPAMPFTLHTTLTKCEGAPLLRAYADWVVRGLGLQAATHFARPTPPRTLVVTFMARRSSVPWPERAFCDERYFRCALFAHLQGERALKRCAPRWTPVQSGRVASPAPHKLGAPRHPPTHPPPSRTNWTRLVPPSRTNRTRLDTHPELTGRAAPRAALCRASSACPRRSWPPRALSP
jgi:hypothetical protein